MTHKACTSLLLLLVASAVTAQQDGELLREVGRGQAQRLEEYNSVFLQKELYFAKRHRIVTVELSVLLAQRDITVTPFEDVDPIRVAYESLTRLHDDAIFWRGHFVFPQDDQLFKQTCVGVPAKVSIFWWNLHEEGHALNSAENRFYSADALFSAPGHSTYVMKSLRYTPRYSVIYEIAPDTVIPLRIDGTPGVPAARTESEAVIHDRYRTFMDSLPEDTKTIRGDND